MIFQQERENFSNFHRLTRNSLVFPGAVLFEFFGKQLYISSQNRALKQLFEKSSSVDAFGNHYEFGAQILFRKVHLTFQEFVSCKSSEIKHDFPDFRK